jgi:hypothetical protein
MRLDEYMDRRFSRRCPPSVVRIEAFAWDFSFIGSRSKRHGTDIDFCVENGGHLLAFEAKTSDKNPPLGQRIVLEAIACSSEHSASLVLWGENDPPSVSYMSIIERDLFHQWNTGKLRPIVSWHGEANNHDVQLFVSSWLKNAEANPVMMPPEQRQPLRGDR